MRNPLHLRRNRGPECGVCGAALEYEGERCACQSAAGTRVAMRLRELLDREDEPEPLTVARARRQLAERRACP